MLVGFERPHSIAFHFLHQLVRKRQIPLLQQYGQSPYFAHAAHINALAELSLEVIAQGNIRRNDHLTIADTGERYED